MANSKKRCKFCKKDTEAETGVQVPIGYFCMHKHAIAFANMKQNKARQKAARVQHKADKERIKPKSKWLSEAQVIINRYVRTRDYFDGCISCSKTKAEIEKDQGWKPGGSWDAGHFEGRGKKPQLRFILFNIHKQCKGCNGNGGNFTSKSATVAAQYRINLIEKIGIEKVEWLENNNDRDERKGDVEYMKRVKKIFAKKTRMKKKRIV